MNTNCKFFVYKKQTFCFILEKEPISDEFLSNSTNLCTYEIDPFVTLLYLEINRPEIISLENLPYSIIPKLYCLADLSAVDALDVAPLQGLPTLSLKGENVMVGIIDSGFDYKHPVFQTKSGLSRIKGIWDQNEGDSSISSFPIPFGTYYSTPDPMFSSYDPELDEHGTFLAGICAGSEIPEENFSGVAPEADFALVKLRPARQSLKDYYCIRDNTLCYEEDDLLLAVDFLVRLAKERRQPLVLCLGFESTFGSHTGSSMLSTLLNYYSSKSGFVACLPAGNEANARRHFRGFIPLSADYQDVEFTLTNPIDGVYMELWGDAGSLFSVAITSPSGEVIPRIPAKIGNGASYDFLFEGTSLTIEYAFADPLSGRELIVFRFKNLNPGIWTIRVFSIYGKTGSYNLWLPALELLPDDITFLTPSATDTVTSPGDSSGPITLGAYNHLSNGIAFFSGRGFTANGTVKPELLAPGVNVFGPAPDNSYIRKSGTSVSAALAAGVCALFFSWAFTQKKDTYLTGLALKNYLIRGAKKSENETYPSETLGYGILNALEAFLVIRNG